MIIETPFSFVVGGIVWVIMKSESGLRKETDERPVSYMMGFFVALFVRGGQEPRRKENMMTIGVR